jgi:NAD dependent epimerase/dehydratase
MTDLRGQSILVTGSEGFIGSHLVERLVREGARVRCFVLYNSFGTWGWLDSCSEEVLSEVEVFPGDVRDARRVAQAVEEQDVVFHLASLIAIPYSYTAPDSYVQTNVGGALNVLNACRDHGVSKLVHTSTSEVYGTAVYVPIDESHPLQAQSPYSASKIGADMLARSYHASFGLPVVIARPFNTYGPRQSARAVIPAIISQLLSGAERLQLGSLSPTRDFNFVADTVAGLVRLSGVEARGDVVNLGSGREVSIADLAHTIMRLVGREVEIVTDEDRLRPESSEVDRLLCDGSKARQLGWEPTYSLEQGLAETVQWMRENVGHYRPDVYAV